MLREDEGVAQMAASRQVDSSQAQDVPRVQARVACYEDVSSNDVIARHAHGTGGGSSERQLQEDLTLPANTDPL